MPNRTRSLFRALALLFVCAAATAADAPARRFDCAAAGAPVPSLAAGRLLILPGVGNTRFHRAGFVEAAERQLPSFDVEVRTWGKPLGHAGNHLAYLSNRWQAAELLPALDPSVDARALTERWARPCKES